MGKLVGVALVVFYGVIAALVAGYVLGSGSSQPETPGVTVTYHPTPTPAGGHRG